LSSTSKESAKRAVPRKSEERPAKNTFNQATYPQTTPFVILSNFAAVILSILSIVILSVSEESQQ